MELSDIKKDHNTEIVIINSEIEAIIKDFMPIAKKKKLKISFAGSEKVQLNMHRQYFYIFFSNLLGNAIKYSHEK